MRSTAESESVRTCLLPMAPAGPAPASPRPARPGGDSSGSPPTISTERADRAGRLLHRTSEGWAPSPPLAAARPAISTRLSPSRPPPLPPPGPAPPTPAPELEWRDRSRPSFDRSMANSAVRVRARGSGGGVSGREGNGTRIREHAGERREMSGRGSTTRGGRQHDKRRHLTLMLYILRPFLFRRGQCDGLHPTP